MPRKLMLHFWLAMVLPAAIGHSGEKTYEALTNQGLLHFNRAYYMALPQNNPQTAVKEFILAEKTFQEAIRLAPKRPEAYAHLGQTYFVQDKFTASAEVYEKALDLAPERKDLYLKLASALERSGDPQKAVQVLTRLRDRETDPAARQGLQVFIQAFEEKTVENQTEKKEDKTNHQSAKPIPKN
jgi:tetratricopeptide (TPR) repeat protein